MVNVVNVVNVNLVNVEEVESDFHSTSLLTAEWVRILPLPTPARSGSGRPRQAPISLTQS